MQRYGKKIRLRSRLHAITFTHFTQSTTAIVSQSQSVTATAAVTVTYGPDRLPTTYCGLWTVGYGTWAMNHIFRPQRPFEPQTASYETQIVRLQSLTTATHHRATYAIYGRDGEFTTYMPYSSDSLQAAADFLGLSFCGHLNFPRRVP